MYAILAFIPIIVTVVLMVAFNWPAKRALPLAWVLAAIIGVAVWKMSIGAVALQTVIGFLEAFAVHSFKFRCYGSHQRYVYRYLS